MVLPESLAIVGGAPLFVGSISDVVLYSRASIKVKRNRAKRAKVPTEILDRFVGASPRLVRDRSADAGK